MLKILRKKGVAKKIWWAVAIIIIISFAFFGTVQMNTSSGPSYAGKIFNRKISFTTFDRTAREVEMFLLLRFQDKFNQVRAYINLDSETWDRLILLTEAERQKIKVRDEEVVASIQENPIFLKDGVYSDVLYNDILNFALRIKPRDFEEATRNNIQISRLLDAQTASVSVTDQEVTEEFKKQNQKAQVSYVLVNSADFTSSVTADETESQNYYKEHTMEFAEPTSINTEYVDIVFPKDAKEEDKTATRQKAESIYQQLNNNSNWKEIAEKNGLSVQTTGFFNANQKEHRWSFDILSAVFQLKPNQATLPLETPQGYVIIKLIERKEKFVPEFAAIKDKVAEAVKKIKAKDVAKKQAQDVRAKLMTEMNKTKLFDFTAAAKTLGYEITQTPFFTQGQYLPKIGTSLDFQEAAFQLTDPKTISEPVEIESGYAILHPDGRQEADMSLFEKQKETIKIRLLEEKKNKLLSQYLIQLRIKANLQDNISKMREKV